MGWDKNTKLITLDKVVTSDKEFLMTSKEITNRNMHEKLIIENFSSTFNYFDLCTKYFNKYYFEVEKSFVAKINKNESYLMDTEKGYNELLNSIRREIDKKQTIEVVATIFCIGIILILLIKFWYIAIGVLIGLFFTRAIGLVKF